MEKKALPDSVTQTELDGKKIYLVGTAHVSKESVQDVRSTVEAVQPDTVCVELCPARYKTMCMGDAWRKMDIFKVLREKKAVFLLAQLILSAFYRRIGEQLGVQPGAEMLEAVQAAEKQNAALVLADRSVEVTLKRVWGFLGFLSKIKLFSHLLASLFISEKLDESSIEQIKQKDQLEAVLAEFAEKFPEIKKRLIDERDIFLAQKIRETEGNTVVAVVGAGHVAGIVHNISQHHDLDAICQLPPKSRWTRWMAWSIPLLILFLFVWGFFTGGAELSWQSIGIWVVVNGTLAAVGSALALAHPFTIVATFVAAPFTSLNPLVAAGWIAGLVQAWVRKPTVCDLEQLPEAISSVKGFWHNPVSRILLVVVLANLGSSLGTFISGTWIAANVF